MRPFVQLPFLENTSPPPFYQAQLSDKARKNLDKWFIGERSQAYYLKRFDEIDKAGKLIPSWHWASFFMTFGWLLYRKRYLDCLVYCVAGTSFIKVNIVLSLAMLEFLVIGGLDKAYQMPVRASVALVIWLFWAGMVARWSNAYYYRMARREIADALRLYPNDDEAQKAYLAYHGGVGWVGLLSAFGIFGVILMIIALQFVPMIATQQEKQLLYQSYQTANHAKARVEAIYQNTGQCPVGLPLTADSQQVSMTVVASVEGVKTGCAIKLVVTHATYPVRYLNGQTLVLYRLNDNSGRWRCQSSLNKAKTPQGCV